MLQFLPGFTLVFHPILSLAVLGIRVIISSTCFY